MSALMVSVNPTYEFNQLSRGDSPVTVERFSSSPSTPPLRFSFDHCVADSDTALACKGKLLPPSPKKRPLPGASVDEIDIDFILGDDPSIFGEPMKRPMLMKPPHRHASQSTSTALVSQQRRRPSKVANDDAAVAAYLMSPDARWNDLAPLGTTVNSSAVTQAACMLGFAPKSLP